MSAREKRRALAGSPIKSMHIIHDAVVEQYCNDGPTFTDPTIEHVNGD